MNAENCISIVFHISHINGGNFFRLSATISITADLIIEKLFLVNTGPVEM